jgi:hypothetical protein
MHTDEANSASWETRGISAVDVTRDHACCQKRVSYVSNIQNIKLNVFELRSGLVSTVFEPILDSYQKDAWFDQNRTTPENLGPSAGVDMPSEFGLNEKGRDVLYMICDEPPMTKETQNSLVFHRKHM